MRILSERVLQDREKGQGLVEFALTIPVAIILILVIIEFAFAFFSYVSVVYATREGSRVGALHQFSVDPGWNCNSAANPSLCRQQNNDSIRTATVRTTVTNTLGWLVRNSASFNAATDVVVTPDPDSNDKSEARSNYVLSVGVTYRHFFLTQILPGPVSLTLKGESSARME